MLMLIQESEEKDGQRNEVVSPTERFLWDEDEAGEVSGGIDVSDRESKRDVKAFKEKQS